MIEPAESLSNDPLAADLRGFGPTGIVAILVILLTGHIWLGSFLLPLGALLVLAWVRASHTPWRAIGYARPKSWLADISLGIVFGIALKFAVKAVAMPLLGADPINHAYHHWVGNTAALPLAVWAMFMAGFAEETVYRGFAFERLGRLLGAGAGPKTAIVLSTSAVFALAHYSDQGFAGVEQALMTGLAFGAAYAVTGRIWTVMCAHTAYDLAALAMIYLGLESDVAQLLFK